MSANLQAISPVACSEKKEQPLQPKSPILYAPHRAVQHPRLMFYHPKLATKDAAIAIKTILHNRCHLYFNLLGVVLSILFSIFFASACVTCTIVSFPLMMTSGIGFFASLLAESIALFCGVALYATKQRLKE